MSLWCLHTENTSLQLALRVAALVITYLLTLLYLRESRNGSLRDWKASFLSIAFHLLPFVLLWCSLAFLATAFPVSQCPDSKWVCGQFPSTAWYMYYLGLCPASASCVKYMTFLSFSPLPSFFLSYKIMDFIMIFSYMYTIYICEIIFTPIILFCSPDPSGWDLPPWAPLYVHVFLFICLFLGLDSAYEKKTCNICLSELGLFHLTWRSLVHPFSSKWHNFILLYGSIVYVCHNLFTHSSIVGHLGRSHRLPIVNSAMINMGVHIPL
jgi:hypothetical protein